MDGFVVGLGAEWALLVSLADRNVADGWTALRLEDIASVTRYPVEDCFEIKVMKARGQWPPLPPASMSLGWPTELLTTAQRAAPLVALHREYHLTDACWIGRIDKITDDTVRLHEVSTQGAWLPGRRLFDLDDVTRIDFGGGYAEGLSLVAGEPTDDAG